MHQDDSLSNPDNPIDANTLHESLRKRHFERLNGYRNSAEYVAFAKRIGAEFPPGEHPSLIGMRWEIDRTIYDEFLELLLPLGWKGGTFYLSEFSFEEITAKFTKEGSRFYCEFARYPARNAVVGTPWGVSQHARTYAPGIVFHSTAEHGGFHLSPERIAEMPRPLQDFVPFGGPQPGPDRWFEEDCDWSVVALAFPHLFPPESIAAARATLKGYRPDTYAAFLAVMPEAELAHSEIASNGSERAR